MANKNIMVVCKCPQCGKIYHKEMDRKFLFEKDSKGVGRLDYNIFLFNGTIENPKYVNCEQCDITLTIEKVENVNGIPSLSFCESCGKMIEPKIASDDGLCEICD